MPDLFDPRKEIVHREKTNAAFAKGSAAHDLSLEFVAPSKEKVLAHSNLAPRPYQALPFIWIFRALPRQQHLHASSQELAGSGIVRA